jgi:cell division GTPase FtsZ
MVIDENLKDKVRVTVIATGFGDRNVDSGTLTLSHVNRPLQTPVTDSRLEMPSFARKSKEGPGEVVKLKKLSVLSGSDDEDKYEIPTFLRKQAE